MCDHVSKRRVTDASRSGSIRRHPEPRLLAALASPLLMAAMTVWLAAPLGAAWAADGAARTADLPAVAAPAADAAQAVRTPAAQENRFDAQIKAMVDRDRLAPPPQQAILFIGSSIFRLWEDLAAQMAPLPVFNRAFGGSRTWEVLSYMDQIVLPYKPKVIVYYCGSNDVNAGESAAAILGRTREFIDRVHAELPATQILYFSINKSLDKRDKWAIVDDVNASMKAMSAKTPWVTYVESNTALFDAKGDPRAELYLPDGLHFKPPAYVLFTDIVKPVLSDAWRAANSH